MVALPQRAALTPGRLGDANQVRLRLYGLALAVAAALFFAAEWSGRDPVFWVVAVAAGGALAWGLVSGRSGALRFGTFGLGGLAAVAPLGMALAGGARLDALRFWPQILVLLFASRVLAEESSGRYAAFWLAPDKPSGSVEAQSMAAAVAAGLAATFLFYQGAALMGLHRSEGTTLGAILRNAVLGETGIHRGIIVLFSIILAFVGEAALIHARDRAAFRALQTHARAAGRTDLRTLVTNESVFAGTRIAALIQDALAARASGDGTGAVLTIQAFQTFHTAARRFVRSLLPFLPLLGFFGTVVGLATAMAALPHGAGDNGLIDISGSLAGLAVKFETTLLGIAASMVASLALAALERREAELAAECALFVDRSHGPTA